MKTSVCITTLNEEKTTRKLLDSLLSQTKKADEIVIVDGGSKDATIKIINHYQKKSSSIKLLKDKCSRARGRNLAIREAKNEIIAMTDAGCTAQPNWLKKITRPFENKKIDVVAGFYEMTGNSNLQKAESVFLGVGPEKFDNSFLPSTRSVAFRKEVWRKIGGFPENLDGAAEDTVFNYKLIKKGLTISRVKAARVEWVMPETVTEFARKIFEYAKGDAKSKILIFPGKGVSSHNIKALLILMRYMVSLWFLIFSPWMLVIGLAAYLYWSVKKVGFWGIILQFTSDLSVSAGFISGII